MYYTAVTLGIFILILVLVRFKVALWASVLIGSVLGGFLFGMNTAEVAKTIFTGTTQIRTVGLVIITLLILTLSNLMNSSGLMESIVHSAGAILRRPAVVIAALPALIGLLPMPGGALFSAPMVKTAAKNTKAKAEQMSTINYWYRHIWEHWWPLYPGVMLSVTLTGLSIPEFALFQLPLGIFMAACGILLYRNIHPDIRAKTSEAGEKVKRKFLMSVSPIWILLLVWLPVSFIAGKFLDDNSTGSLTLAIGRYLPLACGLTVSIVVVFFMKKQKLSALTALFKKKATWSMEAIVIAVMVFQYMLVRAGAAGKIAEELLSFNVPVVLVVAVLPLIAGLVTGLAIGFVGTSFPIVLALVGSLGADVSVLPYVALAYGFGHLGMMLSPIHICHIVTNEFFKTNFMASYKQMWPTFAANFTLVACYFMFLRYIT